MPRSLTVEERNKIKNLQVSNSIYRKKVKELVETMVLLKEKIEHLEKEMENQMGEELQKSEIELTKLTGTIENYAGKIHYIESRIAEKEHQIDEIKNTSIREDEIVIKSWDPNDPEFQKKFAIANAELDAKITRSKGSKKTKQNNNMTEDF